MKKSLVKPPSAAQLKRERLAARDSLNAEILGRLIGGITVIRRTLVLDRDDDSVRPAFSREPLYLRHLSDGALLVLASCERRLRADGDIVIGGQVFFPFTSKRSASLRRLRLAVPPIENIPAADWLESCFRVAQDVQASINVLDSLGDELLLAMGIELCNSRILTVNSDASTHSVDGVTPGFLRFYLHEVIDRAARIALEKPLLDARKRAERDARAAANAAYNRLAAWRRGDEPPYAEMKNDMDVVIRHSRGSFEWQWPEAHPRPRRPRPSDLDI